MSLYGIVLLERAQDSMYAEPELYQLPNGPITLEEVESRRKAVSGML